MRRKSRAAIKKVAQDELRRQGEPTECGRCGGGPGDPGCGKVIHVIMDEVFESIRRQLAAKEAE